MGGAIGGVVDGEELGLVQPGFLQHFPELSNEQFADFIEVGRAIAIAAQRLGVLPSEYYGLSLSVKS